MSGEFGEYLSGGYFATKLSSAALDACGGSLEITRLWGDVLDALATIGVDLGLAEACDSTEGAAIMSSIVHSGDVEKALEAVLAYLAPYREVARRAIQDYDAAENAARRREGR